MTQSADDIEALRATSHVRDLIIHRLQPEIQSAYRRASQKHWRKLGGQHEELTPEEEAAVALVEQQFVGKLKHRRKHQPAIRIEGE